MPPFSSSVGERKLMTHFVVKKRGLSCRLTMLRDVLRTYLLA